MQDSELHLLPKVRGQVVFSNSVRPEYRQLARHKLTVSVASLKLNLSDRRIGLALDFLENLPAPTFRASDPAEADPFAAADGTEVFPDDHVQPRLTGEQLAHARSVVTQAAVRAVRGVVATDAIAPKMAALDVDK